MKRTTEELYRIALVHASVKAILTRLGVNGWRIPSLESVTEDVHWTPQPPLKLEPKRSKRFRRTREELRMLRDLMDLQRANRKQKA